jgi:3-methylcrotonyl-CoA carboxylase alpha subunit
MTLNPTPIRSLLIANRGEIAVRVIRTCRRMNIRAVAGYSDADAEALHVRLADSAVRIGPSPARESYLNMDAILAAAAREGVDAIHPGYGFLSENAVFAQRCEDAGLIFIGPSPKIVEAMGSKIESKNIAIAAGVPVVPGYNGADQSPATLQKEADRIGYPLLIKASAGGGGRGMRRVDEASSFKAALKDAQAEARGAFGDDAVLLEKRILNPRHLEVQLCGDKQGTLVHLFERDCSVQRNNQKLLEESPAPNLPDDVRQTLFDAALKLGRAIGYDSAGTVEFIMDAQEKTPFFLEMNTRLQVEHPVTELVTGVDLVEWQIIAASGAALPLTQDRISTRGHAIEARITAERADLNFQPATGALVSVSAPRTLRFDTGVENGSIVSAFYDSLLAKAIAYAPTRTDAVERLAQGLEQTALLGVPTIQPLLIDALRHPVFAEGRATTGIIADAFPEGWKPAATTIAILRAVAAYLHLKVQERDWAAPANPWHARSAFRIMGAAHPAQSVVHLADEYGALDVDLQIAGGAVRARIGEAAITMSNVSLSADCLTFEESGAPRGIAFRQHLEGLSVALNGLSLTAKAHLKIDAALGGGDQAETPGGNTLVAPLPGTVTNILVGAGQAVKKGDSVAQMEAMKLVHTLTAPADGVVKAVHVSTGMIVTAGTVLLEITPDEAKEVA